MFKYSQFILLVSMKPFVYGNWLFISSLFFFLFLFWSISPEVYPFYWFFSKFQLFVCPFCPHLLLLFPLHSIPATWASLLSLKHSRQAFDWLSVAQATCDSSWEFSDVCVCTSLTMYLDAPAVSYIWANFPSAYSQLLFLPCRLVILWTGTALEERYIL